MNKRIKAIRKELGLNQDEFAARLRITGSGLSNIENGKRNVTEQMILSICREFGINEQWLRTGEGVMFVPSDDSIISEAAEKYHLGELDKAILKIFLELPPEKREILHEFTRSLASISELSNQSQSTPQEQTSLDIEAELASYRRELELEKTAKEKSGAIRDTKGA